MEEQSYDQLKRNHNSLVEASQKLEDKYKKLLEDLDFWKESSANLEKALDINKNIMRNSIEDMNKVKASYAEDLHRLQIEIRDLQERIKDMEYDD